MTADGKRKGRGALAGVIVLVTLTACAPTAPPERGPTGDQEVPPLNPPVTIRVAEDGALSGAAFYIADARGYFEELGLNVEWYEFQDSAQMLPALAANHVQVAGGITSLSLFNAFSRGIEVKIIGDKGHNRPGESYFDIVIRSDLVDQIREIEDLRGRKVVMFSVDSADEMMAHKFILKGGLTRKEVTFVGGFSAVDMLAALSNRSADAAMLIEPMIAAGEAEGILVRWKDLYQVIGPTENAVVLASPQFVADLETAGRFMLAYIKGARDYNQIFLGEDRREMVEIMIRYTGLKDPRTWNRVQFPGLDPNGYALVPQLREDLEYYVELGHFEPGQVDLDQIIDHTAVEFALQHLGRYEDPRP